MTLARFALYYVPPADEGWARFGTSWLGWDICSGSKVAHPNVAGLEPPIEEITRTPRRYGLHATLKPPFRLADGATPDDLMKACAEAFADQPAVRLGSGLTVARMGGFLALCPSAASPALAALACYCVKALDSFRAAPSVDELERRRQSGLSARQEVNLIRWGYPYVMDSFRFHVTLTGRLPEPALTIVENKIRQTLTPLLPVPLIIGDVALVREDAEGRFHLLHRYALSG